MRVWMISGHDASYYDTFCCTRENDQIWYLHCELTNNNNKWQTWLRNA